MEQQVRQHLQIVRRQRDENLLLLRALHGVHKVGTELRHRLVHSLLPGFYIEPVGTILKFAVRIGAVQAKFPIVVRTHRDTFYCFVTPQVLVRASIRGDIHDESARSQPSQALAVLELVDAQGILCPIGRIDPVGDELLQRFLQAEAPDRPPHPQIDCPPAFVSTDDGLADALAIIEVQAVGVHLSGDLFIGRIHRFGCDALLVARTDHLDAKFVALAVGLLQGAENMGGHHAALHLACVLQEILDALELRVVHPVAGGILHHNTIRQLERSFKFAAILVVDGRKDDCAVLRDHHALALIEQYRPIGQRLRESRVLDQNQAMERRKHLVLQVAERKAEAYDRVSRDAVSGNAQKVREVLVVGRSTRKHERFAKAEKCRGPVFFAVEQVEHQQLLHGDQPVVAPQSDHVPGKRLPAHQLVQLLDEQQVLLVGVIRIRIKLTITHQVLENLFTNIQLGGRLFEVHGLVSYVHKGNLL